MNLVFNTRYKISHMAFYGLLRDAALVEDEILAFPNGLHSCSICFSGLLSFSINSGTCGSVILACSFVFFVRPTLVANDAVLQAPHVREAVLLREVGPHLKAFMINHDPSFFAVQM